MHLQSNPEPPPLLRGSSLFDQLQRQDRPLPRQTLLPSRRQTHRRKPPWAHLSSLHRLFWPRIKRMPITWSTHPTYRLLWPRRHRRHRLRRPRRLHPCLTYRTSRASIISCRTEACRRPSQDSSLPYCRNRMVTARLSRPSRDPKPFSPHSSTFSTSTRPSWRVMALWLSLLVTGQWPDDCWTD